MCVFQYSWLRVLIRHRYSIILLHRCACKWPMLLLLLLLLLLFAFYIICAINAVFPNDDANVKAMLAEGCKSVAILEQNAGGYKSECESAGEESS